MPDIRAFLIRLERTNFCFGEPFAHFSASPIPPQPSATCHDGFKKYERASPVIVATQGASAVPNVAWDSVEPENASGRQKDACHVVGSDFCHSVWRYVASP